VGSTKSFSTSEIALPNWRAGDFDYDAGGAGYAEHRMPDPRIARFFHAALGDATTVLNVGAGTGSYEPTDRKVTAVEPSAVMRAQRPAHLVEAVDAVAEDLPFPDNAFDAAMASFTIHQWRDPDAGLRELRRVARGPVAIMTADGDALAQLWLAEYAPKVFDVERRRFPSIDHICEVLGGTSAVTTIPIPWDCTDGFGEAYYGRPERFLDPAVRQAQSAWGFLTLAETDAAITRLHDELADGEWDRKYGALRHQPEYLGSLRLILALP
jgi:SAM-dependent methyltransferase